MKNKERGKALEKLIKDTFCNTKNSKTVVGCVYINRKWCPKKCKYSQKSCSPNKSNYSGKGVS